MFLPIVFVTSVTEAFFHVNTKFDIMNSEYFSFVFQKKRQWFLGYSSLCTAYNMIRTVSSLGLIHLIHSWLVSVEIEFTVNFDLPKWPMNDPNHYFGLGQIPKAKHKLADTFAWYRYWYRNHISEEKSSYQYFICCIFSIIPGPLKPNLLPNIEDFN